MNQRITYKTLPSTIVDDMYSNFKVRLPRDKQYCGYAVYFDSIITGAIILIERAKTYGLLYMIVRSQFRNKNIGTSLLRLTTENLKGKKIIGFYNSTNCEYLLLNPFFKHRGWKITRCFDKLEISVSDLPKIFTHKNTNDIISQITSLGITLISESQRDEHTTTAIMETATHTASFLNPLKMKNIDPDLTTYIAKNNIILGWIAVSRNRTSQLEADSIYINPDYRHLNLYTVLVNYTYNKFMVLGGDPNTTKLIICIDHKDERINTLHSRHFKKAYNEKRLCFQVSK